MPTATLFLSGFVGLSLTVQIAISMLVLWRYRRQTLRQPATEHPALTVLRPVCGVEPGLARTLESTFTGRADEYEVIFCVAKPDDPAIPVIRDLIAARPSVCARLLVGEDRISDNPKLNNLAKGWTQARHGWIVMIDSNVLLPPDYMQTLFATWRDDTGLVTSPPVGITPVGLWANVEAAFLNTYHARWQLASDALGNGFAQGKVLFWRRDMLEAAGGLALLGRHLAEDVASTKIVRAAGLKVRVVPALFPQPLGQRQAREVWQRQVRWARVRRDGFPTLFAAEILSGGAAPALALTVLILSGVVSWLTLPVFAVVWYGAEWIVAARAGWSASAGQIGSWVLRDLLIPAIWIVSFGSRGFDWRGNQMRPIADPAVATQGPQ